MARGGKIAHRRKTRNRVHFQKKGSDGSDEDFLVGDDEYLDVSEDDYCSSLADDDSDGSFEDFVEEEDEEELVKRISKRIGGSRSRNGFGGEKSNGVVRSRKKNAAYAEEDSSDDDSHDDHDEEFTPDEFHDLDGDDDEDEELPFTKKNKVNKPRVRETRIAIGQKRKRRNSKVRKKTKGKKPIKKQVSRRKSGSARGKALRTKKPISRKRRKITERGKGGQRKLIVDSDSDFLNSDISGYDYTISEEEREQVREANEFCRKATTSMRVSSPLKMVEEEKNVSSQRKRQAKKGKEKVINMNVEVGKQVCGICLSEEGKRTVRGILNCCSHYFCFACIMEWSKVESRCPLCKQRFSTISRTARADGGHDLRCAVISVPIRDQVYQPSEEELRGHLDPYESVLCTECHHGGDDEYMLLCDLCDSPAHTYCVGLGREVPEGNWYCDGCRPVVLAYSNAQINPIPDLGTTNSSSVVSPPVSAAWESFDLNELYVPETPSMNNVPSPRQSIGDLQADSGHWALTLHERRRIQRQIHQLLNDRSRESDRSNVVAPVSGLSLFGSQIGPQRSAAPAQVSPQNMYPHGRSSNYAMPLSSGRDIPRLSTSSGQGLDHQASTSRDSSFGGLTRNTFSGIDTRVAQGSDNMQLHHCNTKSNTEAASRLPYQKEQVQSMVKSHLKSLSRNFDLGYNTFKHIARTSTHTILAACGLEHRWSEVHPIQTQPLACNHSESLAKTPACPVQGQCSSCFDKFVGNVVREVTCTQAPLVSMN